MSQDLQAIVTCQMYIRKNRLHDLLLDSVAISFLNSIRIDPNIERVLLGLYSLYAGAKAVSRTSEQDNYDKSSSSGSNAAAFRCQDAETLRNQFTSGGVLVSVHSPHDAVLWLETHHDHPIIQSLKSALAIFGSIADVLVPQIARSLADLSGFAVMVRSSVDSPIPSFASPEEDPTGQQPFVSLGATSNSASRGFHSNVAKVYDVTLDSCMKFKTQPLTNSDRTIFRPRPEVVSHVNLKVQLRRGETMRDRSFSNLGFLRRKSKRCNQKSTTQTGGGSLGLAGLLPGLNMNAARTRGVSQTMEIADEEAERAGKDFRSYDISWLPCADGEDIAYEMYVEFGLGMYLHKKKQRELPQISSVLRNQVMIWQKGMGILLLTSTYVPNALTNESLEIHETTSVDLKSPCMNHDTSFSEQHEKPYEAAMSVSIATLKKSKKDETPGMLGKLLSHLSPKPSSRGWDATNNAMEERGLAYLRQGRLLSAHVQARGMELLWSGLVEPVAAKVTVPPKAAASNSGGD
ncbi:hypothetical protein B0H14DRAFT_2787676 [Mycena olivaceomarginata]|nr:hypothetical protein B0H14DRAFT_2787676 [Mycena olivaceomarginata]